MDRVQQAMGQIIQGKTSDAMDNIEAELNQRLSDRLDQEKIALAQSMFTTAPEEGDDADV